MIREVLGLAAILAHALANIRSLLLGLVLHRRRLYLGVTHLLGGLGRLVVPRKLRLHLDAVERVAGARLSIGDFLARI